MKSESIIVKTSNPEVFKKRSQVCAVLNDVSRVVTKKLELLESLLEKINDRALLYYVV